MFPEYNLWENVVWLAERSMTPVTAANTRLLIVDDIEDNRRLLSRRFARRGFKSIEADSGPTALDLIAQHTFDLVLLDIMMPGIDGIEVLRRIREAKGGVATAEAVRTVRTVRAVWPAFDPWLSSLWASRSHTR